MVQAIGKYPNEEEKKKGIAKLATEHGFIPNLRTERLTSDHLGSIL